MQNACPAGVVAPPSALLVHILISWDSGRTLICPAGDNLYSRSESVKVGNVYHGSRAQPAVGLLGKRDADLPRSAAASGILLFGDSQLHRRNTLRQLVAKWGCQKPEKSQWEQVSISSARRYRRDLGAKAFRRRLWFPEIAWWND